MVVASLLGSLFLVAGVLKFRNLAEFANLIGALGVLPDRTTRAVAIVIPSCEIALGAAAFNAPRIAAGVMAVLLACFSAVALAATLRGQHLKCSCFGSLSESYLGYATVARNMLLLALAVAISFTGSPAPSSDPPAALTGSLFAGLFLLLTFTWKQALLSRTELEEVQVDV